MGQSQLTWFGFVMTITGGLIIVKLCMSDPIGPAALQGVWEILLHTVHTSVTAFHSTLHSEMDSIHVFLQTAPHHDKMKKIFLRFLQIQLNNKKLRCTEVFTAFGMKHEGASNDHP